MANQRVCNIQYASYRQLAREEPPGSSHASLKAAPARAPSPQASLACTIASTLVSAPHRVPLRDFWLIVGSLPEGVELILVLACKQ